MGCTHATDLLNVYIYIRACVCVCVCVCRSRSYYTSEVIYISSKLIFQLFYVINELLLTNLLIVLIFVTVYVFATIFIIVYIEKSIIFICISYFVKYLITYSFGPCVTFTKRKKKLFKVSIII